MRVFRKKYDLNKVFTPTSYAELSYKRRPELEQRLKSAIKQTGKQIIIYGHSGGGKSTLLNNILKQEKVEKITSQCISETTVDLLMLDAFDQLDAYYISKKSDTEKVSIANDMKNLYFSIKASYEQSSTVEKSRILPPQLSPQNLARLIGAAGYVWIIEDFHKVREEEKLKLSQIMKMFYDIANRFNKVKIIAIGAALTGHEVVAYESELNNRVSEICVPLLTDKEIKDIIIKGTELLNIRFDTKLLSKIINYSNNLATIAHQFAYNICDANGVSKTQSYKKHISENYLKKSMESFVADKEGTFVNLYNKITIQRSGKYQNVEVILKAMAEHSKKELSHGEILQKIHESEPNYNAGNLSAYLKKLCSSQCEEVLRENLGRYSFSDPFFMAYIRIRHGTLKEKEGKNIPTQEMIKQIQDIQEIMDDFYNYRVVWYENTLKELQKNILINKIKNTAS